MSSLRDDGMVSLEVARNGNVPNVWTLNLQTRELRQWTDAMTGAVSPVVLRQEGALGTVAAGALADLLLIDGNPTVDMEDTQKVATVIKGGSPVPRAEMFSVLSTSLDPN